MGRAYPGRNCCIFRSREDLMRFMGLFRTDEGQATVDIFETLLADNFAMFGVWVEFAILTILYQSKIAMSGSHNFALFLQNETKILISKQMQRRDEGLARLDANYNRVEKMFPASLLQMNVGAFLDQYEGNFDMGLIEALLAESQEKTHTPEFQEHETKFGPRSFHSPKREKIVIRRKKEK